MLRDVDEVPWDRLEHAYGDASDVPDLLRALADGDDEALGELFGTIWHQGTVYEATGPAVPFLIEILDAPGADPAGVLALLAEIADGSSYLDVHQDLLPTSGQDTGAVRERIAEELTWVDAAGAAVAAGLPVYLRLLTDGDEGTRAAAARTIALCGGRSAGALTSAAAGDESPLVRASAILALGGLPAGCTDPAPLPRLVAAVCALVDPDGLDDLGDLGVILERDAPAARELAESLPWDETHEVLTWALTAVGDRWELQVRLLTAWLRHPDPEVRSAAVFATTEPIQAYRPAAALLVPLLAGALADPDPGVCRQAAHQLAASGRVVATVAEQLWACVLRGPVGSNTAAASALAALARVHDPRADTWLAAHLAGAGAEVDLGGLEPSLKALGPWAPACRAVVVAAIPRAPAGNHRIFLISAAGRLQVPAADLVPVLRAECATHPHSCTRVLGDLGPAAAAAVPELTALTAHPDGTVRLNTARALWRISGDPAGLIAHVRRTLAEDRGFDRRQALALLPELGTAAADLAGLLPPLFDDDDDWTGLHAAVAYWHLTHDPAPVLPRLIAAAEADPQGHLAVACLAAIGPAAAAAVPLLREGIDSERRQLTIGSIADWVRDDESWIEACAAALEAIERPEPVPTSP